jgi:SNF2 family DNA or RNA helicase
MPPQLLATLMPHQEEGVKWCLEREEDGCILADDMGLGKTVTSCALLISNFVRTLIIVPLALLSQWASEIEKHTSGISVDIYHGGKRVLLTTDVTLTTTHTMIADFKKGDSAKYSCFDRVIIDEAHKLKNSNTHGHMVLSTIFRETRYKVLLTGTPICNSINDLISLILLLNRAPYNDSDYWKGLSVEDRLDEITAIKNDLLLHRTKDTILKNTLPDININSVKLPMGKKKVYRYMAELPFECKLIKILRMRQALNDVGLINLEDLEMGDLVTETSEKIAQVREILDNVPTGDKVVVFSQWACMLDILALANPETHLMYTGKVNMAEKTKILEEFKTNPEIKVLYITLKCGGCGLNLNVANHAIIVEPYFNHAEEKQAIDRIYRIGQEKQVHVHKLSISSSIECWMKQLQSTKLSLANMILKNTGTSEDIMDNMAKTRQMFEFFVDGVGEGESEGESEGDPL